MTFGDPGPVFKVMVLFKGKHLKKAHFRDKVTTRLVGNQRLAVE